VRGDAVGLGEPVGLGLGDRCVRVGEGDGLAGGRVRVGEGVADGLRACRFLLACGLGVGEPPLRPGEDDGAVRGAVRWQWPAAQVLARLFDGCREMTRIAAIVIVTAASPAMNASGLRAVCRSDGSGLVAGSSRLWSPIARRLRPMRSGYQVSHGPPPA